MTTRTFQMIDVAYEISSEYAPHNGSPMFWRGYREYLNNEFSELAGADAQAYDRGAELAMRMLLRTN